MASPKLRLAFILVIKLVFSVVPSSAYKNPITSTSTRVDPAAPQRTLDEISFGEIVPSDRLIGFHRKICKPMPDLRFVINGQSIYEVIVMSPDVERINQIELENVSGVHSIREQVQFLGFTPNHEGFTIRIWKINPDKDQHELLLLLFNL